ncbi:MAG: hypothetical protein M1821_009704 [Bathelium mastoideum]|nr:MAG: hypothetical protein M1821_009704 [Bathelium mastoideum]
MTSGEPFAVKHTNVSRPQLAHAASKQSETASEDYYSLSDEASSNGDDAPYRTPPSRFRSPDLGNGKNASRSLLSLVTSAKRRHQEQSGSGRQDNIGVKRKPVPPPAPPSQSTSLQPPQQRPMDETAPTPGIDDTPYIRFAIEQLTRDEEVRGSRAYANPSNVPPRQEAMLPDLTSRHLPEQQEQQEPESPPTPPQYPEQMFSRYEPLSTQPDKLVPYQPPKYSVQYPELNFRPAILRPASFGVFIFLCILMLTGLLFSSIWSLTHSGLWNYGTFGDGRYFVFEYLPTLLGIILFIWLIQIELAVYRLSPFIAMASDSTFLRCYGPLMDLYPTTFLLPDLQHFRAGLPIIGVFLFISWLQIFTIPLLASSFDVRYDGNPANGAWRWMAVQGVIWVAIILFIALIVASVFLLLYLRRVRTGLKWDPRSLADVVVLLERANGLSAYQNSEAFDGLYDFAERLGDRADRLGYWHTYKHPAFIFYGLGEEGAPTRRYTIENGQIREKGPENALPDTDLEAQSQRPVSQQPLRGSLSQDHFQDGPMDFAAIRYRYLPWILRFNSSLLWALTATVLLLAFLIVSFVNRAVLAGFLPDLPVGANSAGFSAPNFLFSFIPAVLAMLCLLFWLPIDLAFRRLQPYAELAQPEGATADQSLLLDYPAHLPFLCILHAAAHGHWRVAFLSLITCLAATFPVLAGGVFWAQFYTNTQSIRVAAEPSAYYALCVFLALYATGYWCAFAGRRRALPHESRTVAEIISWVYMSRIVTDEAFAGVRSKSELVTRLLSVPVGERAGLAPAPIMTTAAGRNTHSTTASGVEPPHAGNHSDSEPPNLQFDTSGYHPTAADPEPSSSNQRAQQLHPHPPATGADEPRDPHLGPSTSTFESDSTVPSTHQRRRLAGGLVASLNASVLELAGRVWPRREPEVVDEKVGSGRGGGRRRGTRKGKGRAEEGASRRIPRYGFGVYEGRDGREHLGIERVDRPGGRGVGFLDGREDVGGERRGWGRRGGKEKEGVMEE